MFEMKASRARLLYFVIYPDMEFVQNFTPPDFQAKNFTLSISPNFNSFSKKKHKKMDENGEIYTAGKKIYTAAGTDGMDKFHLCLKVALKCTSYWSTIGN